MVCFICIECFRLRFYSKYCHFMYIPQLAFSYHVFITLIQCVLRKKIHSIQSHFIQNFGLSQGFSACQFHPELRYKSPSVYTGIVYCFYCLLLLPNRGIKFPSRKRIFFIIFRLPIRHKLGLETSQTSISLILCLCRRTIGLVEQSQTENYC